MQTYDYFLRSTTVAPTTATGGTTPRSERVNSGSITLRIYESNVVKGEGVDVTLFKSTNDTPIVKDHFYVSGQLVTSEDSCESLTQWNWEFQVEPGDLIFTKQYSTKTTSNCLRRIPNRDAWLDIMFAKPMSDDAERPDLTSDPDLVPIPSDDLTTDLSEAKRWAQCLRAAALKETYQSIQEKNKELLKSSILVGQYLLEDSVVVDKARKVLEQMVHDEWVQDLQLASANKDVRALIYVLSNAPPTTTEHDLVLPRRLVYRLATKELEDAMQQREWKVLERCLGQAEEDGIVDNALCRRAWCLLQDIVKESLAMGPIGSCMRATKLVASKVRDKTVQSMRGKHLRAADRSNFSQAGDMERSLAMSASIELIVNRVIMTKESIYTASADGYVRVFDRSTGALVHRFEQSPNMISDIAFDPTSRCVWGVTSDTAEIRMWTEQKTPDGETKEEQGNGETTLQPSKSVWQEQQMVCAMMDEKVEKTGHNKEEKLQQSIISVDISTAADFWDNKGHTGSIMSVVADGKGNIVTCGDVSVCVWDATTLAHRLTCKGHTGPVWSVVIVGGIIVSVSSDCTLRGWRLSNGAPLFVHATGHTNFCCAVCADQRQLVSASFDTNAHVYSWNYETILASTQLLDVSPVKHLHTLQVHTDCVRCCVMDEATVVTGSWDGSIGVFARSTGEVLRIIYTHQRVQSISLESHELAAALADGHVLVLSRQVPVLKGTFTATTNNLQVLLAKQVIASLGMPLALDDEEGQKEASTSMDEKTRAKLHEMICSVMGMFGLEGEEKIEHFDINVKKTAEMLGISPRITSLSMTNDVAVSGSWTGDGLVWKYVRNNTGLRLAGLEEVGRLVGHTKTILDVAVDGNDVVTGASDNDVRLWNVATLQCVWCSSEANRHRDHVMGVSICGGLVASCSHDHSAKLWNRNNGTLLYTLSSHTERLTKCEFFMGCDTLLTVSADTHVKTWNTKDGTLRKTQERIHTRPISALSTSSSPNNKDGVYCTGCWLGVVAIYQKDGRITRAIDTLTSETTTSTKNWTPNLRKKYNSDDVGKCALTCCDIDRASKMLVVGNRNHEITVWNFESGLLLQSLSGHTNEITMVVLRGEREIWSCSDDNTIKWWEPPAVEGLVRQACQALAESAAAETTLRQGSSRSNVATAISCSKVLNLVRTFGLPALRVALNLFLTKDKSNRLFFIKHVVTKPKAAALVKFFVRILPSLVHIVDPSLGTTAYNSAAYPCRLQMDCVIQFLGRYKVDLTQPIHRSKTALVYFAVELEQELEQGKGESPVCLKFMKNRNEFLREIDARKGQDLDGVVKVLGYHVPEKEEDLEEKTSAFVQQARRERTDASGSHPYLLVMTKSDRSLHQLLGSQRVAGYDCKKVRNIARQIVAQVGKLHQQGIIHFDLKPRNVLIDKDDQIVLCDMDAASKVGSLRKRGEKMGSSGYYSPEVARFLETSTTELVSAISVDVWSIGVLLYELCCGKTMFAQDIANDEITEASDFSRLILWFTIPDTVLNNVFMASSEENQHLSNHVKDLIRWCLHGDPSQRPPSCKDILAHPFFSSTTVVSTVSIAPAVRPQTHHIFISHLQAEASGDVGTLFHLFASMGVVCWRDMNANDLTELGMKKGVFFSDVFVMILTNKMLSSPWCLKEIEWAIEASKTIVIVHEEEERFSPFNLERWQKDELLKLPNGDWAVDPTLRVDYKSTPPGVVELIKSACANNTMLPFRRRDFEVDALTRNIIRRSGRMWGTVLPKNKQHEFANLTKRRTMLIISDPVDPRAMQAVSDLGATFRSVTRGKTKVVEYIEANDAASPGAMLNGVSHIVVLLTGGFVVEHGCLDKQIFERIVNNNIQIPVIYAYSVDLGWNFNRFFSLPNSEIVRRIASHEILSYRNKQPPSLEYEHVAMAVEMLRRAKV